MKKYKSLNSLNGNVTLCKKLRATTIIVYFILTIFYIVYLYYFILLYYIISIIVKWIACYSLY